MADEQIETFIEKMNREQTLPLRAVGGRLIAENARPDRLDHSFIELKCWHKDWHLMFRDKIRIGEDKHKPVIVDDDGELSVDEEGNEQIGWIITQCPIILKILRAQDGWLDDNAARDKDDPILGRFSFHAPIQTSDGVVNEKRATIFAWLALGDENFGLLRDSLLASEQPDFDLGLTVQFPSSAADAEWENTNLHWDGKGSLPVTDAKIVWKCSHWDSETDTEVRELERKSRDIEYDEHDHEEYEPPREHVELMDSVKRLETSIAKLFMPLWVAVGAALIAIWMAR